MFALLTVGDIFSLRFRCACSKMVSYHLRWQIFNTITYFKYFVHKAPKQKEKAWVEMLSVVNIGKSNRHVIL